jgi:hypothetical protein
VEADGVSDGPDYAAEREHLHDGLQETFAEHEHAYLVGWFLIAELRDKDGKPYLAYRTRDVNGSGLTSWVSLGYLHSAVLAAEEQAAETATTHEIEQPEDDDDPA